MTGIHRCAWRRHYLETVKVLQVLLMYLKSRMKDTMPLIVFRCTYDLVENNLTQEIAYKQYRGW